MTLRVLARHDKPVVLYNISGFGNELLSLIHTYISRGFIAAEVAEELHLSESPEALLAVLEAADK
jgi:predicted Rossmann-fold nucleotide-binding protein